MKQLILLTLSILSLASMAVAQTPVAEVKDVTFKNLVDKWVQMEIVVGANKNTDPEAKNERFVDDIKVIAYLAYERQGERNSFDFYKSEVEIITIEQGKKKSVCFYMPGDVVDRDRLPNKPPYYFVILEVNDRILPMNNNAYSQGSLNDATLRSMKKKADEESEPNDYILTPHHKIPRYVVLDARVDDRKLGTLRIRDPKAE